MALIHFTSDNFEELAVQSELPVMIDFWAPWCGPCRMLAPVIEQLAAELEGKAVVGKIDVDEEPALAARFGVMSIPTVVVLKGGKEIGRSVGFVPKEKLLGLL